MANIKPEPGKQPIGSPPKPPERPDIERKRLITDPNRNQAGNDRGSADNTQGSQTGNDIDTVPDV